MNKLKLYIVDDERLARFEIRNTLKSISDIEIVGEAGDVETAIDQINSNIVDVVLLDINLSGRMGFEVMEEIPEDVAIIFITAYDEYAVKAFEMNALDYILKPVLQDRLEEALSRVRKRMSEVKSNKTELLPYQDHIYVKDADKAHFIALDEILLFASFGNYIKIYFKDECVLVHRSLKQIEERLLGRSFFRANRLYIINVAHIQDINQGSKGKIICEMKNGMSIHFSERKSVLFRERWGA